VVESRDVRFQSSEQATAAPYFKVVAESLLPAGNVNPADLPQAKGEHL
jgi:hypothetical protein